jgi:hypothetical protein
VRARREQGNDLSAREAANVNRAGLADGANWAVRTIVNKYREEFESRVKPSLVAMTVGASG